MEPESSTSAVLEPQGAGTTPGSSPNPPEVSKSPKEGEVKPAEKPPEEGKSSQEPPSPDVSDDNSEKDGVVNVHAHRRIKTERNELRTKLRELEELGIKSKEDAETLLREAETAETEAKEKGIQEVTDWIIKSPRNFLVDLHRKHPQVYEQIVESDVRSFAAAIAGSNKELAEQIVGAAEEFFGNSRNGRRAPEDPERNAVSQERNAVQTEKQQLFEEQAAGEVTSALQSKLQELSKGRVFVSDKQRERFIASVVNAASDALDRNNLFSRQWERLRDVRALSPAELRARRRDAVDLHLKNLSDDLLKRLIEEEASALGIGIADKPPDKNGERREVMGGGAPPKGKGLTQEAKDQMWSELREKHGEREGYRQYSRWLHEHGA